MIGETDVADGAGLFLLRDPVDDPDVLELLPLGEVRELVHQVVVDMVRPQPFQLLVEITVERGAALDEVLGKLRSDIDLVADAVALEDLPQGGFAARVDVGGVVIVHAGAESRHDFAFRLVHVDAAALAGKTHASVTEDREFGAVFIFSVLHGEWGSVLCVAKLSYFFLKFVILKP